MVKHTQETKYVHSRVQPLQTATPRAYWMVQTEIRDTMGHEKYQAANRPVFHRFGAEFRVHWGQHEVVEGTAYPLQVVLEFPDYVSALACYRDPEYVAAHEYRKGGTSGDVVIVEGTSVSRGIETLYGPTPNGYWQIDTNVRDKAVFEKYLIARSRVLALNGAVVLADGGQQQLVEGKSHGRQTLVKFPDYSSAVACFRDPQYQAAHQIHLSAATANMVLVEGYVGPQP